MKDKSNLEKQLENLLETVDLEELMEIKGGNVNKPVCGTGSVGIVCMPGNAITL